jgi:hypothetical protein
MEEFHKFQMSVYGRKMENGGVCGSCSRHRAVVWVEELEDFRCSSCLCGMSDRRGRPKGSKVLPRSQEDQQWVKENFPEHYREVYSAGEDPDQEPTVEEIMAQAGKMGPPESPRPVDEEQPTAPASPPGELGKDL